jgi:hypothetical protein
MRSFPGSNRSSLVARRALMELACPMTEDSVPRLATMDDDGWALLNAEERLARSEKSYWMNAPGIIVRSLTFVTALHFIEPSC